MSRRLRVEEERLRQLKEVEEEEAEDKLKLQLQRIYAPLVWRRTAIGIRIQDLKENYFKNVTDMFQVTNLQIYLYYYMVIAKKFLQEHFIPNDVLSKNTEMKDDQVSVESFLNRLMFLLKDEFSIVALDESKDPEIVVGALIMQVIHKVDFGRVFSRVQMLQGEAMKKCVALTSYINRKVDVFAQLNCDKYTRYYGLCVLPEYRHKRLGFNLMSSGLDVARAAGVQVVMGIFPTYTLQNLAKKLGMEILYEVNYVEWRDADKEMIFDDPGAGNYSCALMAGVVPPPPPPEPPKPKEGEEVQKPPKLTRAEKRSAAAKKAKSKK